MFIAPPNKHTPPQNKKYLRQRKGKHKCLKSKVEIKPKERKLKDIGKKESERKSEGKRKKTERKKGEREGKRERRRGSVVSHSFSQKQDVIQFSFGFKGKWDAPPRLFQF